MKIEKVAVTVNSVEEAEEVAKVFGLESPLGIGTPYKFNNRPVLYLDVKSRS